MKRRDFIRISSASAVGTAVAASAVKLMGQEHNDRHLLPDNKYVRRFPNYCEVCFWNCAGWVYTKNRGDVWKIVGHEKDPHSNGRFCPRGTGGVGMYFDEDRLKTPLVRVERNGKQEFKQVSWDRAFSIIAEKMEAIKAEHGAESIALFKHGSSGKHFDKLFKAFGSTNMAGPAYAQCKGPREEAFRLTFGKPLSSPEPLDIKNTNCLVLLGSHLGENMHNGQVQEFAQVIEKGATIITVDPRYSVAASKSKYWLPIKASTDMALLLSWIHVIVYENRYNKEYVEKNCIGFDQLKEHVKDFTCEWASEITGLKAEEIHRTACEMAHAAPATIVHPGRHVTWYGDDTQRLRAVAILNALFGSYGQKGGFYNATKASLPSYPKPAYPKPAWDWRDLADGKYSEAETAVSNVLLDASLPEWEGDKKIKAWFVCGTNLPLTMPDSKKTRRALDNIDFLVAVDTMPMEIVAYADVVLPECTYIERYDDIRLSKHRTATLALRVPATKPKYQSKPGWWMAKKLGEKLGLGSYFMYDDYKDVLKWQLDKAGLNYDELLKAGMIEIPRDEEDMYFKPGEKVKFKTPSGKIELYSETLAKQGFDPLPKYTPHPEPEEGFYRLNYGRAPMHTFSRTANNPNLSEMMGENNVWINPQVAEKWNITNGQEVYLKNQDGIVSSFPVKARITEGIGTDSVYIVHGFGHSNNKLSRAKGKGVNDNELITNVKVDPIMGGTGMRMNFVTFTTNNLGKEAKS